MNGDISHPGPLSTLFQLCRRGGRWGTRLEEPTSWVFTEPFRRPAGAASTHNTETLYGTRGLRDAGRRRVMEEAVLATPRAGGKLLLSPLKVQAGPLQRSPCTPIFSFRIPAGNPATDGQFSNPLIWMRLNPTLCIQARRVPISLGSPLCVTFPRLRLQRC